MRLILLIVLSLLSYPIAAEDAKLAPNFDIHSSLAQHSDFDNLTIKWSILIPTITERTAVFQRLYHELTKQIQAANLTDQIEILYFRDQRGENLVGFKRNLLLEHSRGEYVCFIDDDDWIHANYIQLIYKKLLTNPDCVSLTGIITENGRNPRKFIHSIKFDKWFTGKDLVYYRPPNHLNPIKRAIAIQFKFPLKNTGEDADWSMQICKSKQIQLEAVIKEPYYFYRFNTNNSVQRPKKAVVAPPLLLPTPLNHLKPLPPPKPN